MTEFIKYLSMKHSKDDNALYYISDETGFRELFKYDLENSESTKVTDEKENVKNFWLFSDGVLIATDVDGNEREQLTLVKKDEKIQVTNQNDYYHHFGVRINGVYYYLRNHKDSDYFELIKNDGEEHVLRQFDTPTAISKKLSDETLLLTKNVTNIDSEVFIYNIENDELKETPLPIGRFKNYHSVSENAGIFVSDYEDGYLNLYSVDKETQSFIKETSFRYDIDHLLLSDDKKTAYLTLNKNGFSKLCKYELFNGILTPLSFKADGVIHSLQETGGNLYILYSGMTEPHAFYQYNEVSGDTTKLFGNHELSVPVNTHTQTFPSFDYLDVPYYLYQQDGENIPTIVHVHGGPESSARPEFNELYYRLYKEGYQIAVPNIRGSIGYSKFYIGLDDQEKRLDALEDVVYLRQHLIDQKDASEDNFFIMGRSYGGLMTLLAVTHYPDLWKGAIDIVGISHMRTLLENTPAWRRAHRSYEYGFIGEHDEFFEDIAPLNKSEEVKCPLRIFHSTNDVRVPYSESVQMYEKMKADGQDVELTAYENEGHQYLYTENVDDMNDKLIRFVNSLI